MCGGFAVVLRRCLLALVTLVATNAIEGELALQMVVAESGIAGGPK
jgi:hypothetical protein